MQSSFKINGYVIKRPTSFKIERFAITKSARLASGLMTMELIAQKRKFYFTYDSIDSGDMKVILAHIWDNKKMFFTLTYVESNETKSAVVYVGSIPSDLFRTGNAEWVWKDFTFDLIEQ